MYFEFFDRIYFKIELFTMSFDWILYQFPCSWWFINHLIKKLEKNSKNGRRALTELGRNLA